MAERHRRAHDHYPTSLVALVPAYLARVPRSVVDGRPLGYIRQPAEDYSLTWP